MAAALIPNLMEMEVTKPDDIESNRVPSEEVTSNPTASLFLESTAWLLILFPHWLLFLFASIAFPIQLVFFIYISNNFFIHNHLILLIFLLLLQICATPLLSFLILDILIFLAEGNLMRKWNKTLYFLFHIQTPLFYLIWSIGYLLSWNLLVNPGVRPTHLYLNFITSAIATCVIGCVFWIIKILILKHTFINYRGKPFFEKIEHLIDQEYVLKALLFGTSTKLYTICNALHKPAPQNQVDALYGIVTNKFTRKNTGEIQETDLQRFMNNEEVAEVVKLFEAAGFCSLESLKSWLVKFFEERKTLRNLFNETNTAIEDISLIISRFIWASLFFPWCFFMELATARVLALTAISSVGLFLGIYRNVPDGIIFVFEMHQFDIDDCCIVANQKLVVKEIGIFKTVFYDEHNEMVSFSNSDLTNKNIRNLSRSPVMIETLEFCVSQETSADDLGKLELEIDKYLGSKPGSWSPGHHLFLKEVAKEGPKYALQVTRSSKFEDFKLNALQRMELISELCWEKVRNTAE